LPTESCVASVDESGTPDSKTQQSPAPQDSVCADDIFIREFAANQRQLQAYIATQVSNWEAMDEIFQRVSLALWMKRSSFDVQRTFIAWAIGFAKIEVHKYISEQDRQMLTLTAEALQAVEASFDRSRQLLEERVTALEFCVARLPIRHRQILHLVYAEEVSLQEIARDHGMTPNSLYLQLKRIRSALWKCVTAKVAAEANNG